MLFFNVSFAEAASSSSGAVDDWTATGWKPTKVIQGSPWAPKHCCGLELGSGSKLPWAVSDRWASRTTKLTNTLTLVRHENGDVSVFRWTQSPLCDQFLTGNCVCRKIQRGATQPRTSLTNEVTSVCPPSSQVSIDQTRALNVQQWREIYLATDVCSHSTTTEGAGSLGEVNP